MPTNKQINKNPKTPKTHSFVLDETIKACSDETLLFGDFIYGFTE